MRCDGFLSSRWHGPLGPCSRRRTRLIVALSASAIICVCAREAHAARAIISDTTIIVGANSPGPYFVSGFFMMSGSEELRSNTEATIEHAIDPNTGRITFAQSLSPADTITITFQRLGFALRSHWSRGNGSHETASLSIAPVSYVVRPTSSTSPLRALPTPARLQWQGHKSFSVTASEGQSTDWSQGLELGVEGELLRGLHLSAALSDRQVGQGSRYSSNGGSRLGDLDRFFIEAQSQQFHGRWGELRLQHPGASARRVSGLQTIFRAKQNSFESFIARPQGETRRVQIALREGVLGPYPLSGSLAHVNIVDGSQNVWLGSDRLTEGQDADYTIDAARGTLTLSPRVAFSRQSQMVIEYEESLDDYQRTMAGGVWGWRSSDSSVQQALSMAWEGDDPSQPLFGLLTDEQRDILSNSTSGTVTMPASERVGDHDGDYNLTTLPSGDTVFMFVGPDQGDWDVRFQWVGEGKGLYRHLIDNVYEYTGDGGGLYAPTLTLNAPAAEAVIDESFRIATRHAGAFSLDWQGVGIDPNRLSSGSSRLHSNHAIGWTSEKARTPEHSFASLSWISQSERAATREFGLTLAQFSNNWRLRGDLLDDGYDSYSLSSGVAVSKWLSLHTDAERFDQSRFNGWRSSSSARVRPTRWFTLEQQYQQRRVAATEAVESRTSQHQTRARLASGTLAAEAGWLSEDVVDPARQFTFETDANLSRWLSLSRKGLIVRQEWRRFHDRDLDRVEHQNEFSLGLPAKLLGASSGSGLTALRGQRSVADGDAQPYYGGRLNSIWNLKEDLQVSADIDLSHRRAGSQREVFIPTRSGQGDYRFERGEYVPDPQGDYRRAVVDDENGDASAYDAAKSMRINWRPNWQGMRWTIDVSRRINARYSQSMFAPFDWLIPWTELSSALLPGARLSSRDDHRVSVMPRSQSRATVLLAHEHLLSRSIDQARDDDQRVWRVETEWREELSAKSYFSTTAQYHRRTRDGSLSATIDSDARALLTTIGLTPVQGVGLAIEGRRRLDREFKEDQSLKLWGLRPSTRVSIGAFNGSLSTDFTWLDGGIKGYLSPLLAEGRPLGFSFSESAEVRWQLPSRLSLNARVSGDHRPNEPDRWRMHIETVATF